MNRRVSLRVVTVLIIIVVAASLVVLYENGLLTPTPTSWQSDIEHFANDIEVADGKVFITTAQGSYCFDARSGRSVWSTGYGPGGVQVYEGKVYIGLSGSVVVSLDENTGKSQLWFEAPVTSSYGMKSAPGFFVADGRVFASQNGMAVYNASTGELFWETSWDRPYFRLGNASGTASESNYVLILGTSRVNPNNGSTVWDARGWQTSPAVISQDQVVFWNFNPYPQNSSDYYPGIEDNGHTVLSVNATSGKILWSFDVGTSIFQPIAYNGLLLFGASDGNFYALHLTNGTVAWKTYVDTQNIMAHSNFPPTVFNSPPAASRVIVDAQNQRVHWGFTVTQYGINHVNENDEYLGSLCSLDITTGSILWTEQFVHDGKIANGPPKTPIHGLALFKNALYMTANNDFWSFNATTGSVIETQHFDHYVLPPVVSDNTMFVAADLYLFAYR